METEEEIASSTLPKFATEYVTKIMLELKLKRLLKLQLLMKKFHMKQKLNKEKKQ